MKSRSLPLWADLALFAACLLALKVFLMVVRRYH